MLVTPPKGLCWCVLTDALTTLCSNGVGQADTSVPCSFQILTPQSQRQQSGRVMWRLTHGAIYTVRTRRPILLEQNHQTFHSCECFIYLEKQTVASFFIPVTTLCVFCLFCTGLQLHPCKSYSITYPSLFIYCKYLWAFLSLVTSW